MTCCYCWCLLQALRETLTPLVGQPISVTAIVDVMNHIGRCVVSGNVRRTAEIEIINSPPSFTTDPRDVRKLDGLQLRADDPDGDKLTYTLTGAPAGMTIDKDRGVLKYSGTEDEKGGQYELEAKVDDGVGGTATWRFGINVSAGSAAAKDASKDASKDDKDAATEAPDDGTPKKRERRRTAW